MTSRTTPIKATDGEKKIVSILFVDVVNSTEISSDLDDDAFRELLDDALGDVGLIIEQYHGLIARVQGDGIMAIFGAPNAREDHALCAAHAAISLRDLFTNKTFGPDNDPLSLRIGAHSGQAIIREISGTRSHDFDAIGRNVNIAGKIEKYCMPGDIIVTKKFADLAGPAFEFVTSDLYDAIAERLKISVRRLTGHTNLPAKASGLLAGVPGLVGRDEPLSEFSNLLSLTTPEQPGCLALVAEMGLGKTRLAHEMVTRARDDGYCLIETAGLSHIAAAPYHAIQTLLLNAVGLSKETHNDAFLPLLIKKLEETRELDDDQKRAVLSLFGVDEKKWYHAEPPSPLKRGDVLHAFIIFWQTLTNQHPVILLIDDFHWVDRESRELFSDLAQGNFVSKTIFLLTSRDDSASDFADSVNGISMTLDALDSMQSRRLVVSLADNLNTSESSMSAIVDRSGGNPFFLIELARNWTADAQDQETKRSKDQAEQGRRGSGLPATIEASIASRLDQLDKNGKLICEIAAVVGLRTDLEVLAEASRFDDRTLKKALQAAGDANLLMVLEEEGEPTACRFQHQITREVCLNTIVSRRIKSLNARVFRALVSKWGERSWQTHILSLHAEKAELWSDALHFLNIACSRAIRQHSMGEAIDLYGRALRAIAAEKTTDTRKTEIRLRLTIFGAFLSMGRHEEMLETLSVALELANDIGDVELQSTAGLQFATAQWLAGDHPAAIATVDEALSPSKNLPLPVKLYADFARANATYAAGRPTEAIASLEEVLATLHARDLEYEILGWQGVPSVIVRAFLAWYYVELGRFSLAETLFRRGLEISRDLPMPYSSILINAAEGLFYLRTGAPEKAIPILANCVQACVEDDVPTAEAYIVGLYVEALVASGDGEGGLNAATNALALDCHKRGGRYFWFYVYESMAYALYVNGELDQALSWIDEAIALVRGNGEPIHLAKGLKRLVEIRLAAGTDLPRAEHEAREALAIADDLGLALLQAELKLILSTIYAGDGDKLQAGELRAEANTLFLDLGLPEAN